MKYIVTGSGDRVGKVYAVQVFELPSGNEVSRCVLEDIVNSVTFSPNGRYIAIASNDHTARVFEWVSRKEMLRLTFQDEATTTAFSPDGRYVAVGSKDNTARIMELASGKEIARMTFGEAVKAVVFSPNGRYVAAGSQDHTARIFDVNDGREISRIPLNEPVWALAYRPGRSSLLTASVDQPEHTPDARPAFDNSFLVDLYSQSFLILRSHLLNSNDLIADACSRVTRNLTKNEWYQYVGSEIPYHRTCANLP